MDEEAPVLAALCETDPAATVVTAALKANRALFIPDIHERERGERTAEIVSAEGRG